MTQFAAKTSVSVSQSKGEIENILQRYGAAQFMSGWDQTNAVIGFTMPIGDQVRQVRFVLPMPDRTDTSFTHHSKGQRTAAAAHAQWEQACRQRWRALALVIKAKLEAVESGISIFEDEFLANIVMPGGMTVSQITRPKIEQVYRDGNMTALLPDYSGKGE